MGFVDIIRLPIYLGLVFLNFYTLVAHEEMSAKWPQKEMYQNMRNYRLFFLTHWNFIFQLVFMIVAISDELLKLFHKSLDLSKIRAFMYNTLLFPSSLLVVSVFWILYYIDRELIFARALDEFFPWWLNHMLHTFIVIPVLIELLLPKSGNFVEFRTAAPVVIAVFILYQTLYFSIYFRHGVWLYPIYGVMTWPQRIIFTNLQIVLVLFYQKVGISLQNVKRPQIKPKNK